VRISIFFVSLIKLQLKLNWEKEFKAYSQDMNLMKQEYQKRMNNLFPGCDIKVLHLESGSVTETLDVGDKYAFFSQLANKTNLILPWPNTKGKTTIIEKVICSMNANLLELPTLEDVRSFQFKLKEEKILQEVGNLSKQISASRSTLEEGLSQKYKPFYSETESQTSEESVLLQVGALSIQISASRSTPLTQKYTPFDPETLECLSKTEHEQAIQTEKDILSSVVMAFYSTPLTQKYKPFDPETLECVSEGQLTREESVLQEVGALSKQISASRSTLEEGLSQKYKPFYSDT